MSAFTKNHHIATKLALFGLGVTIGYKYYCKKYKSYDQPIPKSSNNIQLNTTNVTLPKEIDEYFSVAMEAAKEAGNTIRQFINDTTAKSNSMLSKSNHTDIVTQIDKNCENIILSKICSAFPLHKIIAEESCKDPSSHNITNEPTWFIDPVCYHIIYKSSFKITKVPNRLRMESGNKESFNLRSIE